MSNLTFDLRPGTACDHHRVVMPYEWMKKNQSVPKPKVPVFVCNRMPTGGYPELVKRKRQGERVIVDIDDHWIVGEDHYLHERFRAAGISEILALCLKDADVVTVTTNHLASQVRPINRNVVVIPNALPFDFDQYTLSPQQETGTPFIWAGGASHRQDLRLLPMSADLTIAGVKYNEPEWRNCLQGGGYRVKPGVPLSRYMNLYDGHKCALAPLVDNPFNRCKSNLKMLEAGAKGMAFIASKCRPYFNEVDQDIVLYADNKSEFYERMQYIKKNPSFTEDYSARLAEHVRLNYHLTDANELRRQVIEAFS